MKNTSDYSKRLSLFSLVLFLICFYLYSLVIAQAPDIVSSKQSVQTNSTEKALLWENDWTLQPDNNHHFGTMFELFDHGMAYLGDDKVLLFGGMLSTGGNYQETYIYDLSQNTWIWQISRES